MASTSTSCILTLVLLTLITFTWASTAPLRSGDRGTQQGHNFRRMKALDSMPEKFSSHVQDSNYPAGNNVVQPVRGKSKYLESLPVKSRKNKYTGYKCPMGQNSNGNGLAIIEADPYDCSKYYYCVWGIEKVSQCPTFLLWNNADKVCDWYWNVDCGNRGRRSLWSFF